MSYPPDFLDRLRGAVRVSEVVGRKFPLRKSGTGFVVADNSSFTCNDKMGIWKEWSNGEKAGDIFAFLEVYEGLTFIESVQKIADLAGIAVPRDDRRKLDAPIRSNGNGHAASHDVGTARRVIVGQWDYLSRNGVPLYQTVRVQWKNPDGTWKLNPKTGKPEKTFHQRRRSPEVDGTWVNSLTFIDQDGEPIEFMRKGPGADWSRYDDKKYREYRYTERTTFETAGNVEHTLLNLPTILEELREERQEQRTIWIPEGEKKVDLLTSWGLLATCNSGGAGNWHQGMAELLRDAADIVILEDNDDAGRARSLRIAPMLLDTGCRVRSLPMHLLWTECPQKGDIVDWDASGGGSRDLLFRAAERLPEWTPPPYVSKYGAQCWGSHRAVSLASYEWLIKGIIPAGHNVLIMGPSGSGKSFEATTLSLAVARGISYNGRRVKRAGVVYLNYEGKSGMSKRLTAYERHHAPNPDEFVPFAWLTRPPGLYASEENAVDLAKDIKETTKDWSIPVGVIVVDTHNAATRGSSEIKTEDVSRIMERYAMVQEQTGAAIWIVGHTNANGQHRGNEVLSNNIETTILIEKVQDGWGKGATFSRDFDGHVIRRVTVKKQREGADGLTWDFVLKPVDLGIDDDGDQITSMVPVAPNVESERKGDDRRSGRLTLEERFFLGSLREAVGEYGVAAPSSLKLARAVNIVAKWDDFVFVYEGRSIPEGTTEAELKKYRARRQVAGKSLTTRNYIGIRKVDGITYLWPIKGESGATQSAAAAPLSRPVVESPPPTEGINGYNGYDYSPDL